MMTISFPVSGASLELTIDSDGDGNIDQYVSPQETLTFDPDKGPSIISAVQIPGFDKFDRGRVIALATSKRL